MRYVIDSSVGLKTVLPEVDSPHAIALCDGFRQGIHELIAPDVFAVEAAHALAKAERKRLLIVGEASVLFDDLILPDLHPSLPLAARALEIASHARIGVYDCLYVALAEREQTELVTADHRLIRALRQDFPFIVDLASLP
ncbi:MAG: type II toxin-antitoxin system VapC family toxin [Planctomycetes bacterium]|nr:type II toxin-antitoxin system VapC family toxin [Planctomycetota bacterium]